MTDDLTTRLLAAIARAEQEGAKRSCGVVHPQFDTNHPEGHRDEAVLRHCAAHRKIVDLHGREVEPHWNRGQRHDYAVCSGCFTGVGTGERVAFPCDTLVALAEVYDLTTEPAPATAERKTPVHDPRGYHYGPTETDPDPGSMWHYGCGQQVHVIDDGYVCGCGAMWTEDEHGRVTYIDVP